MSERNSKKGLNRRDFIKSAAVGDGAIALAGFGLKEAKAAQPPVKWDKETDVVVVGSGGTGLAAAVEAADAGADVLLLEKGDHVGGLFIAAGGHAILGCTHVMAQEGIEDRPEWWYEDEMLASDYRAVPELVRTYVDKGEELVLWLEQLGFEWKLRPIPICQGHRVNRSHNSATNFGWHWVTVLLREAERLGVPILLKHRMTRIHRPDPNGPVLGVEVETPAGSINIKARKGVVLAAGGTTDNARMCMAQDPRLGPDVDIMGDAGGPPPGGPYVENTGDAHLTALDIGADLTDMSIGSFLAFRYGSKQYFVWEPRDWTDPSLKGGTGLPLRGDGFQRVIWVKADGKRYVNESLAPVSIERKVGPDPYAPNALQGIFGGAPHEYPEHQFLRAFLNLKERPRNVWVITDAEGATALNWPEDQMRNPDPKVPRSLYPDSVAVADTLAELASKMNIPAAAFEATVSRYNSFVDAGQDQDFERGQPMYRISEPPFFGAKANLLRHTQGNGLRINTKAQVIERSDQWDGHHGVSIDEERVISHLYAAGECTGFLGWRRTHGKLGVCVIFGRIAGQNAGAETRLR